MDLNPNDLKVETFRAPGSSGWVMQPETHVKITHTPTGLSAEAYDDRSVHRNRIKAYEELQRLVAHHVATKTLGEIGIVEKTIAPSQVRLYGCHDAPRPVAGSITHYAQAGWTYLAENKTRIPVMVPIYHTMSTECHYDKQHDDKRCLGCTHIRK